MGPTLPDRSSLYSLSPVGIGTPYVESLSSYLTRLAEAHVVSVWQLIRHVSRVARCYPHRAKGLGKGSHRFLEALKAATCRKDLHRLTLCPLQRVISQLLVFRNVRAWCPACLEGWQTSGDPIYGYLLWTLRLVTVCPVHLCTLVERCPHCQSHFAPLTTTGRVGYCSACFKWLGRSAPRPPAQGLQEPDRYARWVAVSIGQLLAALPSLETHLLPATFEANLLCLLTQTEGATRASLSALAGPGIVAFSGWLSGRLKPSLDQLCRLCYRLELPLVLLFQGVPADWHGSRVFPGELHRSVKRKWQEPQSTKDELRRTLAVALHESPPPSVAELARRLKFRSPETLRCREPDLCKAIADRRRKAKPHGYTCKQLYPKGATARLQTVLRRQSQDSPPSLNQIAFLLGYKASGSIRDRCPEICQQIIRKRRESFQRQREEMRHAIQSARREKPPPPLKQIARRLGFTAGGVLTQVYPEICTAYLSYRKACLEERRHRLRLAIRGWLAIEPAPTRISLCRHFGMSLSYFDLRFPQENREVVERSAEQARRARESRQFAMRKEVLEIVRNLRGQNLSPSLSRVHSALSPGSVRSYLHLRRAIDQALLQLGPVIRVRNDSGRFV